MTLKKHKVLVLNKVWTAVGVATLQRAITLLCNSTSTGEPKARIIDPSQEFATYTWEDWSLVRPKEGDNVIRGFSRDYRIPEVILLTEYDRLPRPRVNFSRRSIYKRDNFTCMYCGGQPGPSELSIDHVLPRALGGLTTWENCVLACTKGNRRKADRTPQRAKMNLLKKPAKPSFPLFKGDKITIPKTWEQFLSAAYWETELKHD